MSACAVLQAALVGALREADGLASLTGVFDAPPVRSALPHAVVDTPVLADASAKGLTMRDGRILVTLHDAGERPVRLRGLIGVVEEAIEELPPDLGEGWRVAGIRLARSRIVRAGSERWTAASEFAVKIWRVDA